VKVLKYLVLAGGLAFLGPAWAIPIAGTSGGTFSGLSGCINCGILDTGNGDDTQARWGGFIFDLNNTSRLTAVDVVIGPTNTDADDIIIGRLDWHNESTSDFSTADRLGVNWNLSIAFSQPAGSPDPNASEQFGLTIVNTDNPEGDKITGFTVAHLNGIQLELAGVTIGDMKYVAVNSSFDSSNNRWINPEGGNASLYITADFRSRVPGPQTLLLLGAALAGLGLTRRKSR
jgi:hypothetical protein